MYLLSPTIRSSVITIKFSVRNLHEIMHNQEISESGIFLGFFQKWIIEEISETFVIGDIVILSEDQARLRHEPTVMIARSSRAKCGVCEYIE